MRVAVLGTGLMGAGMARSLVAGAHEVTAWNRTRAKAEPLSADGVRVVDTVREAVDGVDAVVTMLFDIDATAEVGRELLDALPDGAVWVQCGTVGVAGAARLAELGAGRMVDAPVLGTKKPAAEGALVVLVSGPSDLVERARPVLDAIGSRTILVGEELGQASALKLACNAWVAGLTVAVAQSIGLASALGVDPELFLDAIEGGPTGAPYARVKGTAMLTGDYTPSFEVDGVVKDVSLMVDAAREVGFRTDLLEVVHSLFAATAEAGHGEEDMAAVRRAFDDGAPPSAG
jgi:3-hydroxyisobutyrate dehydrogenase